YRSCLHCQRTKTARCRLSRRRQVENRIHRTGRAGLLSGPDAERQAASTISLPETADSRTIAYRDAATDTSREMMKLIQRLFISAGTAVPQVVVVAGIEQGTGCSWVCARIAEFLTSHLDRSVCLVDANPHSASSGDYPQIDDTGTGVDPEWVLSPVRRAAHPLTEANFWRLSYRAADGA